MKSIVDFDQAIGGDGATAKGSVGVAGQNLRAEVALEYPIAKVIDPLMIVIDKIVDKVEALIPGDQKALAAKLKAEAREEVVKFLAE